ncbi:MAG: DUF1499 domain-containing protein [Candidatus Sericytochromatia bacterium]
MLIFKILSGIFLLLVFMYTRAFQQNKALSREYPGFFKRFNIYFNSHVSETSDTNILPEMKFPRFNVSVEKLFEVSEQAIKNLGWIITDLAPENKEINAIVQTKLFKFKDDIKIRAEHDENSESRLYAHSSSRVGIGDMGANQKHIMDLVNEINLILTKKG